MNKKEALRTIDDCHTSLSAVIDEATRFHCKHSGEVGMKDFAQHQTNMLLAYLNSYVERMWTDEENTDKPAKIIEYKSAKMRDGKIWMLEDLRKPVEGAIWNEEYNCYMYSWEQAIDAVPEGWRLPTAQDFITLATAYGWPDQTDMEAFKKEFSVRYAGYADGSSLGYQGSYAYWWSSSLNSTTSAFSLCLGTGGIYPQNGYGRRLGFSVRCVKEEE